MYLFCLSGDVSATLLRIWETTEHFSPKTLVVEMFAVYSLEYIDLLDQFTKEQEQIVLYEMRFKKQPQIFTASVLMNVNNFSYVELRQ